MPSAIAEVKVDTLRHGTLLVTWEIEGEAVAVDVATGTSPSHVDHLHHSTVPAGRTSLELPSSPGARNFVSVAPSGGGPAVVAADRRVPFEGAANFRDLGGYRTSSGRRVRWGLAFRADSLHKLSAHDLDLYSRLGLTNAYDLRSDSEREQRPSPVPSTALMVVGQPTRTEPPVSIEGGTTTADGEKILRDLYVGLVDHAAVQIGELFTALGRPGGLPAVFHCHAGKDRTGMVAALLLETLGVERDSILDDYELTARYRVRRHQEPSYERLLAAGLSPEAAAGVLTTPRWAMEQALEHLDRRYRGIDEYLTGPAGMKPGDLESLRGRLLDGPA